MRIEDGRIINDFIEPNKRQYIIPVYQRNYEWSKNQCVKLFKDIVEAGEKDKSHFCGTIVYLQLKEEHGIFYYLIIDGQQRLTTIYILLKALLDEAETDKEREFLESDLLNHDKYSDYDIDTGSKLKLKPVKSDNSQLLNLMNGHYDSVDRSCDLWRNYMLFRDCIRECKSQGSSVKDIYRGLEKLICAKIRLDADDNAQEIFERINSTGLPLNLADKIRNFVLMTEQDQDRLYEQYWLRLEGLISRENMTSFLLDYLNFKIDGFTKEDEAYDAFKALYARKNYTNEGMLSELCRYAGYYHAFVCGDTCYGPDVNALLDGLRQLKQTTVFLFLFRVFDDYHDHSISLDDLVSVLRFLLNYSVRRLVCEIGSNSLRGLYKTLYSRVFIRWENKRHYYDAIVSFFMQTASKDALPGDAEFTNALKQNNLYNKRALCKYLLCAIENHGKEKIVTENLTIEHILPQNKNLSTAWQRMLGDNWQNDRDQYLNTLGNLTLTAYNGELGDRPFEEKLNLLSEFGTKAVVLYADVKNRSSWDAAAIVHRAEKLAAGISEIFSIRPPETEISFADPSYVEYGCDDPDNATYTIPCYYILQGERVNVGNFAELLRSLLYRLYIFSPRTIEIMAANNEKLNYAQYPLFSYDRALTRNGKELGDSGIFESSGFSARHIISIIPIMLDRCDIDRQDFVYCARSTRKSRGETAEANEDFEEAGAL